MLRTGPEQLLLICVELKTVGGHPANTLERESDALTITPMHACNVTKLFKILVWSRLSYCFMLSFDLRIAFTNVQLLLYLIQFSVNF